MDLAALDAPFHLAVGFVQMRAIVEAAPLGRFPKLRKRFAQRLGRDVPQPELTNARCIDDVGLVAEVEESRGGGGVAAGAFLVHVSGRETEARVERVENRRLPDAA